MTYIISDTSEKEKEERKKKLIMNELLKKLFWKLLTKYL